MKKRKSKINRFKYFYVINKKGQVIEYRGLSFVYIPGSCPKSKDPYLIMNLLEDDFLNILEKMSRAVVALGCYKKRTHFLSTNKKIPLTLNLDPGSHSLVHYDRNGKSITPHKILSIAGVSKSGYVIYN